MTNEELWLDLIVRRSRSQRDHIQRDGLRRGRVMDGVWFLVAYDPGCSELTADPAADYEDGLTAPIDIWLIHVLRGWTEPFGDGWHAVFHDVPSCDCHLVSEENQ